MSWSTSSLIALAFFPYASLQTLLFIYYFVGCTSRSFAYFVVRILMSLDNPNETEHVLETK